MINDIGFNYAEPADTEFEIEETQEVWAEKWVPCLICEIANVFDKCKHAMCEHICDWLGCTYVPNVVLNLIKIIAC